MSQKKRFLLRLDSKLYEILEKWSADELRSVNAQIEYLLKEAARKAGRRKEKPPSNQQNNDLEDNDEEIN
ncbi:MAG: hypothetical protein WBG73_09060 [Coleofasciculaceae cyanobacterium]